MATYSIDKIKYGSNTYKLSPEATEILNLVYPIGSIYMSVNNVSPHTFLGGSWDPINGRFLVAQGSNGAEGDEALTLSAGATGGKNAYKLSAAESGMRAHTHTTGTHYHTLSSHTHAAGDLSVGPSSHKLHLASNNTASGSARNNPVSTAGLSTATFTDGHTISGKTAGPSANYTSTAYNTTSGSGTPNTGGVNTISDGAATSAHENLPPYLAVYMWKRIA